MKQMQQIFKNRQNIVLLTAIISLYLAFLSVDLFSNSMHQLSTNLKYASIVMCFLLAISLHWQSVNRQDSRYVVVALALTLVADWFLLFTNNNIAGIFWFCLVQLVYLKRCHKPLFQLGIVVATCAVMVDFLTAFRSLHVIAGLYALLIIACLIATFKTTLPKFNLRCVQIGMLLFVLCDLHVALLNRLPATNNYRAFAVVAIWLFYLPAQCLLALSAFGATVEKSL